MVSTLPIIWKQTVREMRRFQAEQGVDASHCVEKSELRALVALHCSSEAGDNRKRSCQGSVGRSGGDNGSGCGAFAFAALSRNDSAAFVRSRPAPDVRVRVQLIGHL